MNNNIRVTGLVIAHNEEKRIKECLESLKSATDEIIVIHDGPCKDKTLDISRKYTKRVYIGHKWGFSDPHRIFAHKKAKGEWILVLDADERLTEQIRKEIPNLIKKAEAQKINGYEVLLQQYMTAGKQTKKIKEKDRQLEVKTILYKKNKSHYKGIHHHHAWVEPPRKKRHDLKLTHIRNELNWSLSSFFKKHVPRAKAHANYRHASKLDTKTPIWYLIKCPLIFGYYLIWMSNKNRNNILANAQPIILRAAFSAIVNFHLFRIKTKKPSDLEKSKNWKKDYALYTRKQKKNSNKKIKIGMLSPFGPKECGVAIYSENLCKELSKKTDVTKIGDKTSARADYQIDFESFQLKQQLRSIIEKEQLDLLHVQYMPAFFGRKTLNLNLLSALNQNVPVVSTLHDVYYDYKGYNFIISSILQFLENKVVKTSDAIIAHTPNQTNFLKKKYNKKNAFCIYHGLETFQIKNKKKRKNILYFGLITKKKGLDLLINAMKRIPQYNLFVAGKALHRNYQDEIKKLAKETSNISIRLGWVPEKSRWNHFRKADLVALPYRQTQCQSGVLHNAVSQGLPVVATKSGALHELVEKFRLGKIVDKNPTAIAEGIKEVMKNYGKYRKNLSDYRKLANWKAVAKKHMETYRKAMLRKT